MNAAPHRNPEPTLHDVMDVLGPMQADMSKVWNVLGLMQNDMAETKDDLRSLNNRIGSLEVKFDDFGEELSAIARAVDSDSVTLLDHERRISRLEKH